MSYTGKMFQHDIFMSYSHGDMGINSENPKLKKWSTAFIKQLEEEIKLSLGSEREGFNIWYDKQLEGNQKLTQELKKRVEDSALLLIVMTPQYLDSEWCKEELAWFENELSRREGGVENVFVVRAFHTDEKQWPEMLKEKDSSAVLGTSFYQLPGDQNSRPYGWPEPDEKDKLFFEPLAKIVGSITKRLEILRKKPPVITPPSTITNAHSIYLAWGTDDVRPDQETLRQLLLDKGVAVEPKYSIAEIEAIPVRINEAIQHHDIFVQLFGRTAGKWDQDEMAPVVYQYHNALKLSKKIITWREPEIPIKTVRDLQYQRS